MTSDEEHGIQCPICGKASLQIKSMLYSVPFFNELAIFSINCPECNFGHNDIFSAEQRPPCRWSFKVDEEWKLRVRVIRSGSGTIRMPEFGIDVEPGPAAESFISNVEGVLDRSKQVLMSAINFADHEEQKAKGREILANIESALEGKFTFTLILEDPAGVSGILPDDLSLVKHEELSREEALQLKGAPMWIDSVREEYRAGA